MKRVFGCLTVLFSVVASAKAVELSEAVDAPELVWETGGDAAWFGQTNVTADGVDAAQSGAISNGQQVWMQASATGSGLLSFWWKVSSESGCDYVRCTVDGVEAVAAISGGVGWSSVSVHVGPGTHVIRWTYSKDGGMSSGSDCGWVDQVAWISGFPCLTTEPSDGVVADGGSILLTALAAGADPLQYQWYAGTSGDTTLPIAEATNSTYATPALTVDASYWVRAWNDLGAVTSRTAQVRIGLEVYTLEDLQKIGSDVDGWTMDAAYLLMNDIDASPTATWNDAGTDETVLEGFLPIGNPEYWEYDYDLQEWYREEARPFLGVLDGKGHVVRGLTVRRGQRGGGRIVRQSRPGGARAESGTGWRPCGRRFDDGRPGRLFGRERAPVLRNRGD